jgi:hypothetical protein
MLVHQYKERTMKNGNLEALISDLEMPVGLSCDGGNIGGWRCAAIKGAVKLVTELLK